MPTGRTLDIFEVGYVKAWVKKKGYEYPVQARNREKYYAQFLKESFESYRREVMTTEKSYGEVVEEAKRWVGETEEIENEFIAQAVIKEFCERNGEAVAHVYKESLVELKDKVVGFAPVYRTPEEGKTLPLFLAPQSKEVVLPSVQEIEALIIGLDGTTKRAEAILELLKEKNKGGGV